jgi:hypothetical protein
MRLVYKSRPSARSSIPEVSPNRHFSLFKFRMTAVDAAPQSVLIGWVTRLWPDLLSISASDSWSKNYGALAPAIRAKFQRTSSDGSSQLYSRLVQQDTPPATTFGQSNAQAPFRVWKIEFRVVLHVTS